MYDEARCEKGQSDRLIPSKKFERSFATPGGAGKFSRSSAVLMMDFLVLWGFLDAKGRQYRGPEPQDRSTSTSLSVAFCHTSG
jgi:hypothetical protein